MPTNSVVLLQWKILDTVTGLYKNNINKYVPPIIVHTYKIMHLMPVLGIFTPFLCFQTFITINAKAFNCSTKGTVQLEFE